MTESTDLLGHLGFHRDTMEKLPIEVVEQICIHLTVHDLNSCCSVSRDWRCIFDNDTLWKPHCCQDLEEYLRVTPCTVTPAFVSPEPESSSLSPVCQWRMAYLCQNHLYNNWRTGNYNLKVIYNIIGDGSNFHTGSSYFTVDFFKEHYLVKVCLQKIELWDLRADPATKVAEAWHSIQHFWSVNITLDMVIISN
ncbi:hypothetical protein J6590_102628 [Homalodisca vitripennis]|nr:hypothetical protein J6590_102628 [Homalodisca vitripennis]